MRTSNGCWTCRLRRKKCDEKTPTCGICAALSLTCCYDQRRPEWMDGRARQKKKAEQLKREIKANTHRRQRKDVVRDSPTPDLTIHPQQTPDTPQSAISTLLREPTDIYDDVIGLSAETPNNRHHPVDNSTYSSQGAPKSVTFGHIDSVLSTFYLENLFPFLFPFYTPSPLRGGKAWIFEIIINSSVVRQVALCYSSYFFSLTRGNADHNTVWEKVLKQNKDAYRVLRSALQAIDSSSISERPHGAVEVLLSLMQLQRFDVAISNFSNCQAHLNAAIALFQQLLRSPDSATTPRSLFRMVMGRLGLASTPSTSPCTRIPSAEQAAFRLSSATIILDDIMASILLQEQPKLYAYHNSLLGDVDNPDGPPIDLEVVIGCKNNVLIKIGEISALDAWKQRHKAAESLDVVELVRRSMPIEESLKAYIEFLESNDSNLAAILKESNSILRIFTQTSDQQPTTQRSSFNLIWTHAALLYLFVVVSGWQPSRFDVHFHVSRVIELIKYQLPTPELLRTMVWPFCVAGCLAEPAQESHFREIVLALQPQSVFGTVYKALEIMENVWHNRDVVERDIAMCFKGQSGLVLLV